MIDRIWNKHNSKFWNKTRKFGTWYRFYWWNLLHSGLLQLC